MRAAALVVGLLSLAGCYASHELGARPRDGGPGTPTSDAGPIEPGRDAGSIEPASSLLFLLGTWDMPEPSGASAHGFDLDLVVSTGVGGTSSCVDATPDSRGIYDPGDGVDNAMASIVPTLHGLAGQTIAEVLASAVDEERFIHVAELIGLDDFTSDPEVSIVLHVAMVVGGIRSRGGSPEPNQRVDLRTLARGSGRVDRGRFRGQFEILTLQLTHPETGAIVLPLHTGGGIIAFDVSTSALSRGVLGGSTSIEDVAARAEESMPGLGETVRSVLQGRADMRPHPLDPTVCQDISFAYTFEGVAAHR